MVRAMKGLLVWFATLGMLLSLLGFWAEEQERLHARPVDPSVYAESMDPELPAIPEGQSDAPEIGPALTF